MTIRVETAAAAAGENVAELNINAEDVVQTLLETSSRLNHEPIKLAMALHAAARMVAIGAGFSPYTEAEVAEAGQKLGAALFEAIIGEQADGSVIVSELQPEEEPVMGCPGVPARAKRYHRSSF